MIRLLIDLVSDCLLEKQKRDKSTINPKLIELEDLLDGFKKEKNNLECKLKVLVSRKEQQDTAFKFAPLMTVLVTIGSTTIPGVIKEFFPNLQFYQKYILAITVLIILFSVLHMMIINIRGNAFAREIRETNIKITQLENNIIDAERRIERLKKT